MMGQRQQEIATPNVHTLKVIVVSNNNIYLLQLGLTRWQWLFYMYTKHEIGYY